MLAKKKENFTAVIFWQEIVIWLCYPVSNVQIYALVSRRGTAADHQQTVCGIVMAVWCGLHVFRLWKTFNLSKVHFQICIDDLRK